jgi:hypothetical protein
LSKRLTNYYAHGVARKMNKPKNSLLQTLAIGVATLVAGTAYTQEQTVYSDSTTYTVPAVTYFDYAGSQTGITSGTAGNEVVLAPGNRDVNYFSAQFQLTGPGPGFSTSGSPAGGESVQLTFYANNGPVVDGYASPGTTLFQSQVFTLASLGLAGYTAGNTVVFNAADLDGGITVPTDFTWALTFSDIPTTEDAGLTLYSPPTVGANYQDAWVNTGSGWSLDTTTPPTPVLEFGAVIQAVPDSGPLWPSVAAIAVGFFCVSRFTRQQVKG